jgi:Ca2+-binding RTX toxin-like protein
MTAPQILEAIDDVSPKSGEVQYGEYTNDVSPVIRVSLGDQAAAGELLALSDNGAAVGASVTLTAAQVAQGYADVPLAKLPDGWNLLTATLADATGKTLATSMSFALGVATATPAAPSITGADDGTGTNLADGAHTHDATPTFHVFEAGLPPAPTGSPGHAPYGGPALLSGHIQLYEGDRLIGDALIGYDGTVTVTPGALSPGEHTLTAVAVDRAGNASAPSEPFHLYVDASGGSSGEAGQVLQAGPGALVLHGGAGADTLQGTDKADILMGGAGADSIVGGARFNDVNGGPGDDVIVGRSRLGDWLMGGQGADSIDASQSSGHNLINGNLGADTLAGGSGGDLLRGGQGDDVVHGGAGADWISGDLGHNTLSGGAGADLFFAGHGVDRVTDFDASQGDRVLIDGWTRYTVTQSGADTVIDLGGRGQMVLSGVRADSLTGGWILHV